MERILIHFKDPTETEALEVVLIRQGYAVTVANDAEQRSKYLSTINFDYVIEDIPEDDRKESIDNIVIRHGSLGTSSLERPLSPHNIVSCLNLMAMNNRLRQENSILQEEIVNL